MDLESQAADKAPGALLALLHTSSVVTSCLYCVASWSRYFTDSLLFHKPLLPLVRGEVSVQMSLLSEAGLALVALERPDIAMQAEMNAEVVALPEIFATNLRQKKSYSYS